MIDFQLSANDQRLLEAFRKEAEIARRHARYYDEHEHEFPQSNWRRPRIVQPTHAARRARR